MQNSRLGASPKSPQAARSQTLKAEAAEGPGPWFPVALQVLLERFHYSCTPASVLPAAAVGGCTHLSFHMAIFYR